MSTTSTSTTSTVSTPTAFRVPSRSHARWWLIGAGYLAVTILLLVLFTTLRVLSAAG